MKVKVKGAVSARVLPNFNAETAIKLSEHKNSHSKRFNTDNTVSTQVGTNRQN